MLTEEKKILASRPHQLLSTFNELLFDLYRTGTTTRCGEAIGGGAMAPTQHNERERERSLMS